MVHSNDWDHYWYSFVHNQFMFQRCEQEEHFYHNKCNGGLFLDFTDKMEMKNQINQELCA